MISAIDKGGLSASTLVSVNVMDVNDNSPIFAPDQYNIELGEKIIVFTINVGCFSTILRDFPGRGDLKGQQESPVVIVQATDQDEGSNGEIRYEVSSGNDDGLFKLNPESGALYVRASPSSPLPTPGTSRQLFVDAVDGGGKISGNQASLRVTFTSEEGPSEHQFRFVVPEDILPYSEVGKIDIPGK